MVESVAVDINTLNCGYFFNNYKKKKINEKTKEYQKKKWGEGKEQGQTLGDNVAKFFEYLLPDEDKEWEEVDETIEGKE